VSKPENKPKYFQPENQDDSQGEQKNIGKLGQTISCVGRNAKPSFDKFHDGDLPIPCPIPIR